MTDKKDNFLGNYNERDYNSGNVFDSINNINLCSFKDGIVSNKKDNKEKRNDNNIILSSNSYNNTNKF